MIFGNRTVAWFLILILILEPALGIGWIFAAEGDQQPTKRAPTVRRRAASTPPASAATDQSAQKVAQPVEELVEPGEEKFLTELSKVKVDSVEKARKDAREVYANLTAEETRWTENLDILGPDETSPVLEDSIFGQKGKERINLLADDIEAKALMDRFATEFRLNIVSKSISARNKIKATLYDLPLETVFQVLLEQANLTYEKRNGIFYLQEKGKGQDSFLSERFFKLKRYADFAFARSLIDNIAVTKGSKIIANESKHTFFVVEYERNLKKIEKVLAELGYLEDLDPDASTFYYHYLSYSYVNATVVKEIIEKYKSLEGKFTQEEKSNRFIVFESRARFEKMKEALSFVDVPRGQVFIDVLFVDLTRSDSEKLGIDTVIDWNPGSPTNADQLVTTLATDVTNFFSYKQPSHLTNIKGTGFNGRSKSNILNNPKVMVLNNEKAVIDVTEKFPFVTNENQSGVISSKIENVDIGVKLDVTPRINANGEVEMEVKPTITVLKEVKNIITKVVDTNQANSKVTETSSEFPITDERSIDTKVVVPSGRTLVIGGLIKETDRKVADHIPGLARLPVLGPLFRRKSNGEEKSQLYIFITPNIVRSAPKSTAFTTKEDKSRFAFFPGRKKIHVSEEVDRLTIERMGKRVSDTTLNGDEAEKVAKTPKENSKSKEATAAIDGDTVNFSAFLKKIASLKEQEKVDNLQSSREEVRRKKKERGFENLIEQLKEDIYDSEVHSSSVPLTIPASMGNPASIQPSREVSTRDQVLGERAQRISNLLEMWEKEPVDGIMVEEDQKAKPETNSAQQLENLKEMQEVPVIDEPVKSFEEPQQEPVVEDVPVYEEERPLSIQTQKEEEPILDVPELEEGISLELISPLGEQGRSRVEPGVFQTGAEPQSEYKETQPEKPSSKKTPRSRPSRSRKTPKRKKVSYFNSSFDLDLKGLGPAEVIERPPSQKRALKEKKETGNQRRIALEGSAEPSWESEFFEKNMAHVTIAEVQEPDPDFEAREDVQDVLHEELKIPSQSKIQRSATPVPPEPVQRSFSEALNVKKGNQNQQAAEPIMRSRDSRTQKIFDELLKHQPRKVRPMGTTPKGTKVTKASSTDERTQKIFSDLFPPSQKPGIPIHESPASNMKSKAQEQSSKTMPRTLPKAEKNAKEREFEVFLKSMFEKPPVNGADSKLSSRQPEPRLRPTKEREFLEFLDSL